MNESRVGVGKVSTIHRYKLKKGTREEEEDEKLVREVFSKVHVPTPGSSDASGSAVITVKRKADQLDAARATNSLPPSIASSVASVSAPAAKKKKVDGKSLGIKITKKPKVAAT